MEGSIYTFTPFTPYLYVCALCSWRTHGRGRSLTAPLFPWAAAPPAKAVLWPEYGPSGRGLTGLFPWLVPTSTTIAPCLSRVWRDLTHSPWLPPQFPPAAA